MIVWSEDRDADRRGLYTLIRNVGHSLFNIQLKKADKMDPSQYMRLPWDEDRNDNGLSRATEEEKKETLDRLLKHLK